MRFHPAPLRDEAHPPVPPRAGDRPRDARAGGSGYLPNVNWWQFTAGGGSGGNRLTDGAMEDGSTGRTTSGGAAAVPWTGTLTAPSFHVETAAGTDGRHVDDTSVR